jgi:hypothetical protein
MNLRELRAAARRTLSDTVEPYLWDDDFIDRACNNAVREACIRARLLKDDAVSQPGLAQYAVTAANPVVVMKPEVLVPRSGRMAGGHHQLRALTAESMDRAWPGWDSATESAGEPKVMVMDLAQKTLRLHPTPNADGTLQLRVWRVPMLSEQMVAETDEPIIQIPDIEELKHWVAYEAYLSPDGEDAHAAKAQTHLEYFEARFGARPSLHEMARWADSPPRIRHAVMF